MAIQKEKTLPNGAVGDYWRLTQITLNRQNLTAIAEIALFKDAAASAAGAPPLGGHKVFRFSFTVPALLSADNVISFIYGLIRDKAETMITHDFFSGEALAEPVATDPDLADGVQVI